MATTDWWNQTLVQEVYYPKGRYNHDYGKKRFVRAPFLLILTQGTNDAKWTDYWMPAPFSGNLGSGGGREMKDFLSSDSGDSECRHPFGYITRQDLTIEEHQLGDWSAIGDGKPESEDTWMRFHRIGFI